jgi:fructose-1,6-bisphosphatase II / sedoheptulose-1,7-bisphosphatase
MLVDGLVVIGEGERDQAPMLYIGEKVGGGGSQNTDIALDPLEGTTLCAKAMPNAIAVIAMADAGSLLHAPDTYMDKIAVGGAYPEGVVDIDRRPEENIEALAHAKGVKPNDISACILDRPRHADLIEAVRSTGAAVHLITDGDVAGVIHTTNPEETGIDIYMGIGGAPEGVLAAAALRCTGGQMQGRLKANSAEQKARAMKMGLADFERKLTLHDMASGDVIFAATGVTDGSLLKGVRFDKQWTETETVVMRSASGTIRWIRNRKRNDEHNC